MAEQEEQHRQHHWQALGIRTDIPHPARVYDYLLGGKDNVAVDREAAEMSLRISPEILDSARANRKFLVRAVEFLRDSGIRQFLDVGPGCRPVPTPTRSPSRGTPMPASSMSTTIPSCSWMHAITAEYAKRGTVFVGRSKAAIQRMFNGWDLIDPGVVLAPYWRPDSGEPERNADRVWAYCGAARTPR